MTPRVLVFIPSFNERGSIAGVIADLRKHLPEADILVVDDGSTDDTAMVAKRAGALVASLPFNQGIGAAVQTGFLFAWRGGYDLVGRVDGDGQHPASELARLLDLVASGNCDLAVGSRFVATDTTAVAGANTDAGDVYRPSWPRRTGIALFRTLLSVSSGQKFTDTTSGLCAANRRCAWLFAGRHVFDYPELELLQRAARQGLTIQEVSVTMRPRQAGRSSITPVRSAYFIFKSLVVVFVGALRRKVEEPDDGVLGVGASEE